MTTWSTTAGRYDDDEAEPRPRMKRATPLSAEKAKAKRARADLFRRIDDSGMAQRVRGDGRG